MEATVVRIGDTLGFKVSEEIIKSFDFKVGTKVKIDFQQNGNIVLRKKSKAREDWDSAFALYALEGEDNPMLPDFLDSETNTFSNGLSETSYVVLDQIKTIDKVRCVSKIGTISSTDAIKVADLLVEIFQY